jgi:HK97 family phage major capsid protein
MLKSVEIMRRQSAIREELAGLVQKDSPTDDEQRSLDQLGEEYTANEKRYRGALISEEAERQKIGQQLESRETRAWGDLVSQFELSQIVAFNPEKGCVLSGATAEVVSEMRSKGNYKGWPVPYSALSLEQRAGETVSTGTPQPKFVAPILDRLFPQSTAARMGARMINIASGWYETPVVSSSIAAGWAASETGNVTGPTVFSTASKTLKPDKTLGIYVKITRPAQLQSGPELEAAVRRDLNSAIAAKLDSAVMLGAGSSGEPLGIIPGQSTYAYTTTAIGAAGTWDVFRTAIITFMTGNAVNAFSDVNILLRPELVGKLDATLYTSTAISHYDKLRQNVPNLVLTSNSLAAPTGTQQRAPLC